MSLLLAASTSTTHAADIPPHIDARILQLRTSPLAIRVVDSDGRPLAGVRVHVRQTRQAFLFGVGALTLLKHAEPREEARYQKLLAGPFNFATLLSYWHEMEREPGKVDYGLLDRQVARLREMGIAAKAHPMILAGAAPGWAPKDADEVKALNEQRIRDLAGRYRGKIGYWDVVGDATTAHNARNGLGEWARRAGAGGFTADPIRWARSTDPSATLIYNEYNIDDALFALVTDLKARDAAPNLLGLEAHMIDSRWTMDRVWDLTERYAKLGVPLHWSEITVPSGIRQGAGWKVTSQSEEDQAAYVEELYTLLFSHPAVTGITWWNLVDGDWDSLPGGLVRKDLTPKPAYNRLVSLINDRWRTQTTVSTDESGEARLPAFHGEYEITAEFAGSCRKATSRVRAGKRNLATLRFD